MTANVRDIVRHHPGMEVRWWDDETCAEALRQHGDATLAEGFARETVGMYRGDVCRGVALANHGGYYFDVDIQTLSDFREVLPPDTEFSTCHQSTALHASWEAGKQRWRSRIGDETRSGLFQAFIAAKPGHPVMMGYLDRLSRHYSGESTIRGAAVGGIRGVNLGEENMMRQIGRGPYTILYSIRTTTSAA